MVEKGLSFAFSEKMDQTVPLVPVRGISWEMGHEIKRLSHQQEYESKNVFVAVDDPFQELRVFYESLPERQ